MGSVKYGAWNKLFKCFGPAAVNDDSIEPDASKERPRRSYSATVKAVLFDASLTSKPRKKKARRISNPSNTSMSTEDSQKLSKSSHDHEKPPQMHSSTAGESKTNYSYWSSLDSSSSSSRASSLALETFQVSSAESKQVDRLESPDDVRKFRRINIGLCMFLVSFPVLIFQGRVCAIFCTVMMFLVLFACPGKQADSSVRHCVESPEIGLEEHKKKVIMEGLLERNHSRFTLTN